MQIPDNFNKNKNLDKALIIMATIMITIAFLLIHIIVLNNTEIQISKQGDPRIKASYSAIENNTWDISEK